MIDNSSSYLPFSQRTGLESIPPQLKLGEASGELRRLLDYYINLEIEDNSSPGYNGSYINDDWRQVAKDLHVRFYKLDYDSYSNSTYELVKKIKSTLLISSIARPFDLVEFLFRHPVSSNKLRRDLAGAFVAAKAAYRIVENVIVAIGNEEQAEAFERAIADAAAQNATASKAHLVAAGQALKDSNWAGSVRESIHAVEAVAVKLAPGSKTLGEALKAIEKTGSVRVHGALKDGFLKLYGYTNDERGIRHALSDDEAQVDEADALFMLGSCASFVSYLLARTT